MCLEAGKNKRNKLFQHQNLEIDLGKQKQKQSKWSGRAAISFSFICWLQQCSSQHQQHSELEPSPAVQPANINYRYRVIIFSYICKWYDFFNCFSNLVAWILDRVDSIASLIHHLAALFLDERYKHIIINKWNIQLIHVM